MPLRSTGSSPSGSESDSTFDSFRELSSEHYREQEVYVEFTLSNR